jgi:hypothetical protein
MVRSLVWLELVVAMLLPVDGHANHDRLPNPPPHSTSQKLPAFPSLDRPAITVSGLSSGGFFAHQFHVAFSSLRTLGCPFGECLWIGSRRQSWPAPTTTATATTAFAHPFQRLRLPPGSSERRQTRV